VSKTTREEDNRRAGEKHDAQLINTVMNSIMGSNMDLISLSSCRLLHTRLDGMVKLLGLDLFGEQTN